MLTRRQFSGLSSIIALALTDAIPSFANTPGKIVFVHGRAQQGRSSQEIAQEWGGALNSGLDQANHPQIDPTMIRTPFYGDELDRISKEFELPLASEINQRGDGFQDSFLEFQEEIVRDLAERAGVTEDQISAEYGDNPRPRGPQNWEWVQALIRAIDKNAEGVTASFLEVFLRDVFLYTKSPLAMKKIDEIVSSEISEEPTIIVSHSLGTVVTYSILKNANNHNVPLLITLGSPLGIRPIRNRFRPIRFPNNVGRWINIYDERDIVSLYPLNDEHFAVTPPIENVSDVRNQTSNHHGAVGYLDKRIVADSLHHTMR